MPLSPYRDSIANRLLQQLPRSSLDELLRVVDHVELEHGQSVYRADAPVEHVYFIDRGLISVVKTMRDGRSVEVATVGTEGVTAANSLFGIDAAVLETMVQISSTAYRIRRGALRELIDRDSALRMLLQRYNHFFMGQMAQTAACNRLHSMEERCARWLLIANDNASSESFILTQEFLAMMLGVQRSGVSLTANILKKEGLIDYSRGHIHITDRTGLEAIACECYGTMREALGKLFGKPDKG